MWNLNHPENLNDDFVIKMQIIFHNRILNTIWIIFSKTIFLQFRMGNLNFQPNEVLSCDLLFWLPFPKDLLRQLIEVLLEKNIPLSQAITIERQRLLNRQTLKIEIEINPFPNILTNFLIDYQIGKLTYSFT